MSCDEAKHVFYSDGVLFATHGSDKRTPSIGLSMQTYKSFAPAVYVSPGENKPEDAFADILCRAVKSQFRYVVYVDADCFICSVENLVRVFAAFKEGRFVFAGMPDGGCVPIRSHNKYLVNPFFSMFDVR